MVIFHNIYDLSDNKVFNLESELNKIGVSSDVVDYMSKKFTFKRYYIKNLDFRAANILKQEALSCKSDAAISYKTYTMNPEKTDVLLCGSNIQLGKIAEKLLKQPFKLKELGNDLKILLEEGDFKPFSIGKLNISPSNKAYIMGIINITPDSFYSGSRVEYNSLEKVVLDMIENKVDIIDIGGESTRPSSEPISEEEEIRRVIPAIELIRKITDIPISIDTYKSKVAKLAIEKGADLVNDISALTMDENMVKVVSESGKPVVLMHMKGKPKNMQINPFYEDLIDEVYQFFKTRIKYCIENNIDENKIIIDPGIGFGKRYEDNLILTKYLRVFKTLKKPIMYAASRKSFIGMALSKTDEPIKPEERLFGSLASHLIATDSATILRIHDYKETMQMEILRQKIYGVNRA